ncbi:hypothetical protein ACWY2R_07075 [Enterococcus avium]
MKNYEIRSTAILNSLKLLPSYEFAGFYELAAPVYIVRLLCEITSSEKMPIIHDTVIRLLHHGMEFDHIPPFLGLNSSEEIVKNAWMDLATAELINHRTNKLTDTGRMYIRENRLELNKQIDFTVEIDAVTGKYMKNEKNLIKNRNLVAQNIGLLHKTVEAPTIQGIDKDAVKELFKLNMDKEYKNQKQKILDVLYVKKSYVQYRRVSCVVLINREGDIKISTYDRNIPLVQYDSLLEDEVTTENSLASIRIDNYLADNSLKQIQCLSLKISSLIDGEYIRDIYDRLFFEATRSIFLVIPLVSGAMFREDMIDLIVDKASRGTHIEIFFSGKIDTTNQYQKKQITRIAGINKKNIIVNHIPNAMENIVFTDGYKGVIIDFLKKDIPESDLKYLVTEAGAKISSKEFKHIKETIENSLNLSDDDVYKYKDKTNLRKDMNQLLERLYPFESMLRKHYGKVWRDNESTEFPEITQLRNIPLAKDVNSFRAFLSSLNKLFFESLPNKQMLFRNIKNDYPTLFKAIDRIRVYRNSLEHSNLKPNQTDLYEQYLLEDLAGRAPLLVDGGFLIIQGRIMQYLDEAIKIDYF